ncbi:hypothetical protein KEM55_007191, partial [Ascosphaera atra]
RLLAMPLPSVMYYFSFVNTSLDILRALGYKAPFRISSTPKGSVMPTALYVYIEDIVAVDGGGGQVYRRALRNRYLASPMFRQMLFEMNCFWTAGAFAFATAATVLVFTLERDAALVGLYLMSGQHSGQQSPFLGFSPTFAKKKPPGLN